MSSTDESSGPTVRSEFHGGVRIITLHRPHVLNAVDAATAEGLVAQLEEAAIDVATRVVVITGAGRAFCVGDDIKSDMEELERGLEHRQHRAVALLREMPKPTIASIRGYALGFGFDLALACDFRIVARDAQLADARAALAIPIATGATVLLPQVIGLPRALDILLSGRRVTGEEAAAIGLVTEAIQAPDLEARTAEFAERFAQAPTRRLGLIKACVYASLGSGLGEGLAHELELYGEPVEDTEEGLRAFREKREPRFTGR